MDEKLTGSGARLELPLVRGRALADFATGMGLPLQGARFLGSQPRLWWLVLVPLALNLTLFTVLLGWGFTTFSDWLSARIGGWQEAAWYLKALLVAANILFTLTVLLVVYFIFTPVALLLASPFNDQLAEKTEKATGFGLPDDDRGLVRTLVEESWYAVRCELKRLAIILGIFIGLLALQWIPLLGALLGFGWACWSSALEFTSYAADRRHLPMRETWGLLRSNLPLSLGFGVVSFLLLLVPFLNVLMVPVAAVGGTLLFGALQRASGDPQWESVAGRSSSMR